MGKGQLSSCSVSAWIKNNGGTGSIYIGTYSGSATGMYNFNGTLDEMRIFNRAITPDEAYQLYQNPDKP